VAPALTSRGVNEFGLTGESGFANYGLGGINVPFASFPALTSIAACNTPANIAAGYCTLGTNVTGMQLTGGNGGLKPQTGTSWGLGFDWTPTFVDGLRLSATYWSNELRGGITSPVPSLAINSSALSYLLTIAPTQAQIDAAKSGLPQTGALGVVNFIYNYQQRNVLNLNVTGLDIDARYTVNTDAGRFNAGLGFTKKLKFDQQIGGGSAPWFSVLGTAGFNTTFPSLKLEGRANLGWQKAAFDANLYLNYTGSYRNWSGAAITPVTKLNGVPTGGGDAVSANTTVDLNLGYKLAGRFEGTSVFVDATNLLDREPPFYAGGTGYDSTNASPLGRVFTVGFRTKF
jgi:iron complex outermembrane receptor protein